MHASPYAWVLPHPAVHEALFEIENMLDRDYYSRLLRLARALARRDRSGVLRLVGLEIALANAIWALRLRFFFGMDAAGRAPAPRPGHDRCAPKGHDEAFRDSAGLHRGLEEVEVLLADRGPARGILPGSRSHPRRAEGDSPPVRARASALSRGSVHAHPDRGVLQAQGARGGDAEDRRGGAAAVRSRAATSSAMVGAG